MTTLLLPPRPCDADRGCPEQAEGLSVLVVDDEDDTAQSFAELLAMHGCAVRTARSGPAALRAVEAEMPDVILLDIAMPGMSGWEVARRLRARGGRQPLVVAVTGFDAAADRSRSADAGMDLHLAKPVEPPALAGLLAWAAAGR